MIPQIRNAFRIVSLSVVLSFFSVSLFAQVYVKADGTGDGSSWATATADLKTVLDNASNGAEIWVATGTYRPTTCTACTNIDRAMSFEIPEGVAVYGGFLGNESSLKQRNWAANPTILSADINMDNSLDSNSFTIIYTDNVSSATIVDGFTIKDANANQVFGYSSASRERSGAGWYNNADNNSSPTIRNCRFENNFVTGFGAGIYNNARNGGQSASYIGNCTFEGNEAIQSGGAIFNDASLGFGTCSPTIVNCTFENNIAKYGGGVYNSGLEGYSSPEIIACRFINNTANSYGGACYNFGKSAGRTMPLFTNSVFVGNQASSAGAIYSLADGGFAKPEIVNCTFYDNHASTGGAVYCNESDGGDTEVSMFNCIFWGNTANFNPTFHMSGNGTPIMNISHTLIDAADCAGIMSLDPLDSLNCVGGLVYNQDPLFEDISNYNFHLKSNSPAKDLGDNLPVDQHTIYFDMDSLIRVHNEVVDFGAYERDAPEYIAPSIVNQPNSQSVCVGEPLQFMVSILATGNITYQWQKNGQNINSAISDTYTIASSSLADVGEYACKITSFTTDFVWTEIALAEVTNLQTVSNSISATTTSICAGESITFTANSNNAGTTPSFQWQINGENIGSNASTFTTNNLTDADQVTCLLTSSIDCAESNMVLSNMIEIEITDALELTVEINTLTPNSCFGDWVSFNANPIHGGTNPVYQWQVNGENVGTNNELFTSNSLADNDEVTCIVTSSLDCILTNNIESNAIAVEIAEVLEVAIDIQANTMNSCAGEPISFTAQTSNGGNNPVYQWQVNGEVVGTNSTSFSSSNLSDNDEVTCMVNSSLDCILANNIESNTITVAITQAVEVGVTIQANTDNSCAGEPMTFTAETSNGGTNPAYQWQVNGETVGSNSLSFSSSNLSDNDVVTCVLSSSLDCILANDIESNAIAVAITEVVEVSIDIQANTTSSCIGEPITFTAQISNGGTSPSYQWQVNGETVGSNSLSFSSSNLSDNDQVTCRVNSSLDCIVANNIESNAITVEIADVLDVAIEIQANTMNNCAGDPISFTALVSNGGITPVFQWQVNGQNIGMNSFVFTSSNLTNNDEITCILESSLDCVSANGIGSNAIAVSIEESVEVTIDIEASALAACEGTAITFTANSIHGGNDPNYQWQVNGMPVGTNSSEFTTTTLNDNDLVNCILTSSEECTIGNVVNSSSLMINVFANVEVDVSIFASSLSICGGEEVVFSAEALNPGNDPVFQWFVNGINTQNVGSEWTTNSLIQGDQVTCMLTSSETCTFNNDPISNALELMIEPQVDLVVEIETSTLEVCLGDEVSFTAMVENGGNTPVFDWRVNGQSTTEISGVFTTDELLNEDVVDCIVTSSHPCLIANLIASNSVQMMVDSCNSTPIYILEKSDELTLFPNPNSGEFQIQIPDLIGTADLSIFDVSGKTHHTELLFFDGQGLPKTIRNTKLSTGVYIIILRSKDQIFTSRLVVKP